jgi:hypothetical protein
MMEEAETRLVAQALDDLGREIGVEVSNGALIIPFDDFQDCFLRPGPDGAQVVLETALLMTSAERQADILRKAMRLNIDPARVADGALFLDREESVLMLCAKKRVGPDGAKGLGEATAVFIEAARNILDKLLAPDERKASPPEAETSRGWMLRV